MVPWLGVKIDLKVSCTVVSDFCNPTDCSLPGSSVHRDSPGKNTGVSCHFLLQGIFLTQGSNPGSLALQTDYLPTESLGKPSEDSRNNCEKAKG